MDLTSRLATMFAVMVDNGSVLCPKYLADKYYTYTKNAGAKASYEMKDNKVLFTKQ